MLESFTDFVGSRLSSANWQKVHQTYGGKSVFVTGGASFIGSHLVDVLIAIGAQVRVIDDFSSGRREFVNPEAELVEGDLAYRDFAYEALSGADYVFHLAAIHGGRGFIETQHRAMLTNLAIDNNVYEASIQSGAYKIINASSACAYPVGLQADETGRNLLDESAATLSEPEKSFPDGVYGWVKIMGEFQLANTISGTGTKGRSARIFTAYGDRENESHAAIALIAKGLLKADPYPVWGNGLQTRNFTYVSDTVSGLLLLGTDERDLEFDVFNVGTSSHIRVIDFIEEVFTAINWRPDYMYFDTSKPTGVASRASNNAKFQSIFGWEPTVDIKTGVTRTLDWYIPLTDRPHNLAELEEKLMSR